ncbi:MAG TPA: response regulator [Opitutaceae bacterium]|nr:response regulator [Opitutaceae bacterium]
MNTAEKYILLAEDDLVVAELVQHAFATQDSSARIVHVRDGVETLDYLYSRARFEHRPPGSPAVVLLDVKMPRLDGLEVLRQVKSDERLKSTPIVMLTSSQDERDVRESYQLGANAYVVKPVEFRRFSQVLHEIEEFWLHVNNPPPVDNLVAASHPPAP